MDWTDFDIVRVSVWEKICSMTSFILIISSIHNKPYQTGYLPKAFLRWFESEMLQASCYVQNIINGESFVKIFRLKGCNPRLKLFNIVVYAKMESKVKYGIANMDMGMKSEKACQ